MDGRGLMGTTPSPELTGSSSNGTTCDPSSSYVSYRYPPHSGYSGAHSITGNTTGGSFNASPSTLQPQPSATITSMQGSPVSSSYSPPTQFRSAQNGSLLGGYGGFYGSQEQPPTGSTPGQSSGSRHDQQLRRQASYGGGLNNTGSSENNSFGVGNASSGSSGADGGGGAAFVAQHQHHQPHHHHHSDSGPLQQDIHAN